MTPTDDRWIALLRGVVGTTHKAMPQAELSDRLSSLGLNDVRSHAASGNLLFRSGHDAAQVESVVRQGIESFGRQHAVILRRPQEMADELADPPFPVAMAARPSHVLVAFMGAVPARTLALQDLLDWPGPERVHLRGRTLWLDYVDGIGRSRLTSARIDAALGQPATARNWRVANRLVTLSQTPHQDGRRG